MGSFWLADSPPLQVDQTALIAAGFALFGAIVGAALSAIATWRMATVTITAAFEGEKYRQRLTCYQALWSQTQRIRRTPDAEDRTNEGLQETLNNLDRWYFQTGGLLLTDEARKAYFNLIRHIQHQLDSKQTHITPEEYLQVFDAAVALRDVTATEVRGRTGSPFGFRTKPSGVTTDEVF